PWGRKPVFAAACRRAPRPARAGGRPRRLCYTGSEDGRLERRKVAVLGSTGSIGRQALEVIEAMPDRFQVVSLAAGRNVDFIASEVARPGARLVAAGEPASAAELRQRVGPGVQVVWGPEGLMQAALDAGADVVVVAVVGAAGLVPTVRALAAGKRVALANKEALVAGGRLVVDALRSGGGTLLPVDSEHSAIFQCLEGEERRSVRRLVLTA